MLIPERRTAHRTLLAARRSLAFTAALSTTNNVTAEPSEQPRPAERLTLEYGAAPECPGAVRFRAEVRARLARPIEWENADAPKRLRVEIERAARGFRATLHIETRAGASTREFETDTCDDAVVAVALVAALSIDPAASMAPGSALPAGAEPTASPETTAQPAQTAQPSRQRAPRPPRPRASASKKERAAGRRDQPQDPGESLDSPRAGAAIDVGASVSLMWGPAPAALVLGGVRAGFADRAERWLAPRFEITALIGRTGVIGPSSEMGTFTTALARVSACPLRLPAKGAFFVQPCATLDAGWLVARGNARQNIAPITEGRLLLASGPSLQATARHDRWIATLTVGALATFTRNTYVFQNPRVFIYEADLIAPLIQTSAGLVW